MELEELDQHSKCRHCKVDASGNQAGHPLIVQQQGLRGNEAKFFVFSDGQLIPCGSSLTEFFDLYFKFLWVFLLSYPCGLNTFMKFFEHKIYNLWEGAAKVQPCINDVARQLRS